MTKLKNGFSLPEQKERLEAFCKFKGYEIIDYYQDAGISAKTGNYRPEFERLIKDCETGKIDIAKTHKTNPPMPLFARIDDERLENLRQHFSRSFDLKDLV